MRRSQVAETTLPLDLHVLGLPLAFILSQDQTLHRRFLMFFDDIFFARSFFVYSKKSYSYSCMLSIQYVYERILLFLITNLSQLAGAKVKTLF